MCGSSSNSQPKDYLSIDILLTFHQFLLLRTSIFAIPSNVFEGFAIFARMTSKPLSKGLRTSKSTPTGLQNDSRSLPRRSQGGPESCKDQPKSCQDRPKRLQDRPKRSFRAIQNSQKFSKRSPRSLKGHPRPLQEVFWASVLQSFPTVFQEHVGLARDGYVQRAVQIQTSRPIFWLQQSERAKLPWRSHRGITKEWQLLGSTSFPCGLPHWPGGGCGRSPLDNLVI